MSRQIFYFYSSKRKCNTSSVPELKVGALGHRIFQLMQLLRLPNNIYKAWSTICAPGYSMKLASLSLEEDCRGPPVQPGEAVHTASVKALVMSMGDCRSCDWDDDCGVWQFFSSVCSVMDRLKTGKRVGRVELSNAPPLASASNVPPTVWHTTTRNHSSNHRKTSCLSERWAAACAATL